MTKKDKCRPDDMMRSHAQSEALRIARVEAGDRKRVLDILVVAAMQDPLLNRALLQIGAQKAARDAVHEFEQIAKTGGRYLAAHPD